LAALNPRTQDRPIKGRKKRWDAIVVGIGMTAAFSIILMKITGYFPCDIVNALQPSAAINCGDSVESNFGAFFEWGKNLIASYLP
jgi:hypothetical protein